MKKYLTFDYSVIIVCLNQQMPGSVFEISFNIYYDICYRLLALNRYLFQRNLIFGRATYHSCNFKQLILARPICCFWFSFF